MKNPSSEKPCSPSGQQIPQAPKSRKKYPKLEPPTVCTKNHNSSPPNSNLLINPNSSSSTMKGPKPVSSSKDRSGPI